MNRSGVKDNAPNKKTTENGSIDGKALKRKRGRPTGAIDRAKKPAPEPKTKMIDGKLMKRAFCVPKKVLTGKRGRPRKEYVWVEVKEK